MACLHLLAGAAELFGHLVRDLIEKVVGLQSSHLIVELLHVGLVRNFRVDARHEFFDKRIQRVDVRFEPGTAHIDMHD